MFVSVPFAEASMAKDNLTVGSGIEMSAVGALGSVHLSLPPLIGCEGTESDAEGDANEANRTERQSESSREGSQHRTRRRKRQQ